jgi:hypothetical protein
MPNIHLSYQILKFKFLIFQMTSDVDIAYTKLLLNI